MDDSSDKDVEEAAEEVIAIDEFRAQQADDSSDKDVEEDAEENVAIDEVEDFDFGIGSNVASAIEDQEMQEQEMEDESKEQEQALDDYSSEFEPEEEEAPKTKSKTKPKTTTTTKTTKKTSARKATKSKQTDARTPRQTKQHDGFLDSDASDEGASATDENDEDDEVLVMVDEFEDEDDDDEEAELLNAVAGPHKDLKDEVLRQLAVTGYMNTYYGEDTTKAAEMVNVFDGAPTVTESASAVAKSMQPIDLFFFFLPKSMWRHIAAETNRYERQTRDHRITTTRQKMNERYSRDVANDNFEKAVKRMHGFEQVRPHEILVMIGLLVARSLCTMKMRIEKHWSTTEDGALHVKITLSRHFPIPAFQQQP